MAEKYVPTRGFDFDDFVGTSYFEKSMKIKSPALVPVFSGANDKHEEDLVCFRLTGYAETEQGLKQTERMIFPVRKATDEDINGLFKTIELEDGNKRLVANDTSSLAEVYIRVCYKTPGTPNPDEDNLKWVVAVNSNGESVILHGDKIVYKPATDAESK